MRVEWDPELRLRPPPARYMSRGGDEMFYHDHGYVFAACLQNFWAYQPSHMLINASTTMAPGWLWAHDVLMEGKMLREVPSVKERFHLLLRLALRRSVGSWPTGAKKGLEIYRRALGAG